MSKPQKHSVATLETIRRLLRIENGGKEQSFALVSIDFDDAQRVHDAVTGGPPEVAGFIVSIAGMSDTAGREVLARAAAERAVDQTTHRSPTRANEPMTDH